MGLSVIGSIFNITGIAVNRYCYICHSFSYSRLYSYRNTLLFVALIWLLTVVAIVPNFFVGSLRYDPRVYSCTFAQNVSSSYTVAVVVVHFLVPIAVVTFCYLRIWVLVIQVSLLLLCMVICVLSGTLRVLLMGFFEINNKLRKILKPRGPNNNKIHQPSTAHPKWTCNVENMVVPGFDIVIFNYWPFTVVVTF